MLGSLPTGTPDSRLEPGQSNVSLTTPGAGFLCCLNTTSGQYRDTTARARLEQARQPGTWKSRTRNTKYHNNTGTQEHRNTTFILRELGLHSKQRDTIPAEWFWVVVEANHDAIILISNDVFSINRQRWGVMTMTLLLVQL